jgi:hypothetical protein
MGTITLEQFEAALDQAAPPAGLDPLQQALWHEAKGDWQRAHELAQDVDNAEGAWVHAYLHRVEGDLSNAGYWYRRAGRPVCELPLREEWREIARALLVR